jgi:predicted secreted protein
MSDSTAVIGVNVVVQTNGGNILGQRGAKMTVPAEVFDITTKADWPNKQYIKAWRGPITIDCDGLLNAGVAGGAGDLVAAVLSDDTVAVIVVMGPEGAQDTFSGTGILMNFEADAPHDKEATFTCKIQITGTLVCVTGD